MKKNIPVVAIVGRSNVGKSTLFNALLGKRKTIIKDEAGVTRDRTYGLIKQPDFSFTLIDTAGLFSNPKDKKNVLDDQVQTQTKLAIEEADILLVMFDGIMGLHPEDSDIVNLIRKSKKKAIWMVNKCEKPSVEISSSEFYKLGIEGLIYISAAHRLGLKPLLAEIKANIPDALTAEEEAEQPEEGLKIAVLGKPNVGKSTLINQLLGQNRLITSDIAGTTRDSIDIDIVHKGDKFTLIDTAGLRRKARVKDLTVERYSNIRSLSALAKCDVAVLLLDASEGIPTDQDLKIAELIHERGRGLILVINKWDAIEKDHKTAKSYKDAVYDRFRFTRYAPILFVSALSGRRCTSILDKVKEVHLASRQKVQTADLNKIFKQAVAKNTPPTYRGEPIKFYFATQVNSSPPTFVVFFNHPRHVDAAYQRYLKNALRDEFSFEGSDIKLLLRKKKEKGEEYVE